MYDYVCVCAFVCMCVRMFVCVHVCVRACVRARVRARVENGRAENGRAVKNGRAREGEWVLPDTMSKRLLFELAKTPRISCDLLGRPRMGRYYHSGACPGHQLSSWVQPYSAPSQSELDHHSIVRDLHNRVSSEYHHSIVNAPLRRSLEPHLILSH